MEHQAPVRPWLVLAICCTSLLMVSLDATIVNVALPAIRQAFGASMSQLQWVIDAYTMVLACLLMFAGSTADRLGRRRVFTFGMGLFIVGSLGCSLAGSIELLILARVVQALGGTMLNPVAMSIIVNTFEVPAERARAIGVWGSVVGISMALGPLVGGALIQGVGWRAIFWLNVPFGLAAIFFALRFVPESRAPQPRRPDPAGQLLVFTLLASLTYAIIEGPRLGWGSTLIAGLFAVSALSLVALVVVESRVHEPLVELGLFRSIPFTLAAATAVASFLAFTGFLFLNAIYLQEVRHFSAFQAGLFTLPFAATSWGASLASGRLLASYGPRPSLLLAGVGMAIGTALLTQLSADWSWTQLVLTYVVFGLGFGVVNAPITHTAVSGLPKARAGMAAAMASTSRQVGSSLGVALAGTLTAHTLGSGVAFVSASHAFWWLALGCATFVAVGGWVATTPWAVARE